MKRTTRRDFLAGSTALLGSVLASGIASGAAYPDKPIRYIVGFAPGGTSDMVARLINPMLAASLGQPVVIENIPSAGGVVATGTVAKAPADGYTVEHTSNAFLTVTPHLIQVPYDPLRDLEPVAYLGSSVQILCVHPSLPVESVKAFIDYAKAHPGELNYGSSGTATGNHITCEYFKRAAGFEATHVPYRGAAPAIQDLIAGRVQFMTDPALVPYVQAGKVRALGVVDAASHPVLTSLPPLSATIANWSPPIWSNFISAPHGTPPAVKDRLHESFRVALASPDVRRKLGENSFLVADMTIPALVAKIRAEFTSMGELLKAANIRLS